MRNLESWIFFVVNTSVLNTDTGLFGVNFRRQKVLCFDCNISLVLNYFNQFAITILVPNAFLNYIAELFRFCFLYHIKRNLFILHFQSSLSKVFTLF